MTLIDDLNICMMVLGVMCHKFTTEYYIGNYVKVKKKLV